MATLTFDKPGLGGSIGDWQQQTFYDRVEQARAGSTFLRRPSDIHLAHVGLFGVSQRAWICQLAAATYADIPFIITVSGPGNVSLEQNVHYVEHVMRAGGFPELAIQLAVTYVQYILAAAQRGAAYAEVADPLVRPVRDAAWYHLYPIPDAEMWEYFRRNAEFHCDPPQCKPGPP